MIQKILSTLSNKLSVQSYRRLPDDYQDERSMNDTRAETLASESNRWRFTVATVLNVLVFSLSLGLFMFSGSRSCEELFQSQIAELSSFYSPLSDSIDRSLHTITFNQSHFPGQPQAAFLNGKYPSEPTPELDELWQRVAEGQYILISHAEVIKIGQNPVTAVAAPIEWGYGPDMYLASIDGVHKVHCLDAIRRQIYFDHYNSPSGSDEKEKTPMNHHWHIDHCIQILLQDLLCNADAGLITYEWIERLEHPEENYRLKKRCRNYDALLRYQEQNKIDKLRADSLTRPEV